MNETTAEPKTLLPMRAMPDGWVAIPLEPTAEEWLAAQGTLLDHGWDAPTCFAVRVQTLISITRDRWAAAVAAAPSDEDKVLDLLAIMFSAYENGIPVYDEPDSAGTYLGQGFRLAEGTWKEIGDLLNRRRPIEGKVE